MREWSRGGGGGIEIKCVLWKERGRKAAGEGGDCFKKRNSRLIVSLFSNRKTEKNDEAYLKEYVDIIDNLFFSTCISSYRYGTYTVSQTLQKWTNFWATLFREAGKSEVGR